MLITRNSNGGGRFELAALPDRMRISRLVAVAELFTRRAENQKIDRLPLVLVSSNTRATQKSALCLVFLLWGMLHGDNITFGRGHQGPPIYQGDGCAITRANTVKPISNTALFVPD